MPRRPKPWYRKARRSWFVTIAGVQHNLGPDKSAAHEQFHQLMRQPQQQKVSPRSFAAIADAFLEWVHKNRSPATYEWYRCRLQSFLAEAPQLSIAELKPFHVQRWADKNPGHSPTTKRNNIRAVKRCLAWACRQGYLEQDPVAGLEAPTARRREQVISQEEFNRLLTIVPDPAFADLLEVVWETGCRPQECLRVEARHVELDSSRWVFPPSEAKVKSMPRVVYLTARASEITRRRMLLCPTGELFRNSQGQAWNKDSVSCGFDRLRVRMGKQLMREQGADINAAEIAAMIPGLSRSRTTGGKTVAKSESDLRVEAKRKLIQRKAREMSPSLSLYTLRHSWATRALQSGLDSLTVAILMGHKDPSTLARVYQHLSHNPKHLLDQARLVAG